MSRFLGEKGAVAVFTVGEIESFDESLKLFIFSLVVSFSRNMQFDAALMDGERLQFYIRRTCG